MASLADQIKQIQATIAAYQISLAEARDLLVNAKSATGRAAATSDIEI
jgi:hypothetical protein